MRQDRIIVLVDPDYKAQIAARAKALDMSVGEFARRSMDAYDPELDEVTQLLHKSAIEARGALDEAMAEIDETLGYLRKRREEAAAAKAKAEKHGAVA